MRSQNNSNNGLNIGEWIMNHSYAIIVAIAIIAFDWGVNSMRIGAVEEATITHESLIKTNTSDIIDIKLERASTNARIITTLEIILEKLEAVQKKQEEYDRSIKQFYEKYDLTPKGN